MRLYELMHASVYYNVYFIYARNEFGECFKIDEGTWIEMLNDPDGEYNLWWHCGDEVDQWLVTPHGNIIVYVRDKQYKVPAKERGYREGYMEKWDRFDPNTRPYRYTLETEEYPRPEEESLRRIGRLKDESN